MPDRNKKKEREPHLTMTSQNVWISRIKINPTVTQAERKMFPTKTDPNLSVIANARIWEKSYCFWVKIVTQEFKKHPDCL